MNAPLKNAEIQTRKTDAISRGVGVMTQIYADKAENAEMRASLKGEAKINEFLDKLKSVNVPAGGNTNSNENNSSESATNQQNTNNNHSPRILK